MRVAAIDCGTNSIRLLIADVDGGTLTDVVANPGGHRFLLDALSHEGADPCDSSNSYGSATASRSNRRTSQARADPPTAHQN